MRFDQKPNSGRLESGAWTGVPTHGSVVGLARFLRGAARRQFAKLSKGRMRGEEALEGERLKGRSTIRRLLMCVSEHASTSVHRLGDLETWGLGDLGMRTPTSTLYEDKRKRQALVCTRVYVSQHTSVHMNKHVSDHVSESQLEQGEPHDVPRRA